MPEFVLDTSGRVPLPAGSPVRGPYGNSYPRPEGEGAWFGELDAFTQGYIEAMFFSGPDEPGCFIEPQTDPEETDYPGRDYVAFSDLAPETLARIIEDCASFQKAAKASLNANVGERAWQGGTYEIVAATAGRDFWYTRNGHGCGFWDGDWPEPYATQLTDAAEAFGQVDAYLGDDGKVYLS